MSVYQDVRSNSTKFYTMNMLDCEFNARPWYFMCISRAMLKSPQSNYRELFRALLEHILGHKKCPKSVLEASLQKHSLINALNTQCPSTQWKTEGNSNITLSLCVLCQHYCHAVWACLFVICSVNTHFHWKILTVLRQLQHQGHWWLYQQLIDNGMGTFWHHLRKLAVCSTNFAADHSLPRGQEYTLD